jgi:hypothetical protein
MKAKPKKRAPSLCVQCGKELDDFCFSPGAEDAKAVRAHAMRCRVTGKAHGRVCSKVFIAGAGTIQPSTKSRKRKTTKKTPASLKRSIIERIRQEPD